jgi:hypothetical protein
MNRLIQNFTKNHKILQKITKFYKILQNFTKHYFKKYMDEIIINLKLDFKQ